jgi:predicted enzyme related to lactoylglutathione lyase
MVKNFESFKVASGDATKLAKFYEEKIGLKQTWDAVMGEDQNVYGFSVGNRDLVILDSKEVKGRNSDSSRIMFTLEVDDINAEFAKLKGAGVKVVDAIYHIEEYGHVATFEDLDGNHFQLVKTQE